MQTVKLSQKSLKFSLPQLSKIGALALAVTCGVAPVAFSTNIDTQDLNIAPGGTLDITGPRPLPGGAPTTAQVQAATRNAVIVRASTAAAHAANIAKIRTWVNSGYNGGLWDGTGITANRAAQDAQVNGVLGVMLYDNTQLGFPTFEGAVLDADPEFKQTLLRMTYLGDFNASGSITGDDYGLLDFYLGSGLVPQGDLNADNLIDGSDYGILDFGLGNPVYGPLGSSVPAAGPAAGPTAVPEPGSAALLLMGAAGLAARRRRSVV